MKAGGDVKVVMGADRYAVEIRIPFAAMGAKSVAADDDRGVFLARSAMAAGAAEETRETARIGNVGACDPVAYARIVR